MTVTIQISQIPIPFDELPDGYEGFGNRGVANSGFAMKWKLREPFVNISIKRPSCSIYCNSHNLYAAAGVDNNNFDDCIFKYLFIQTSFSGAFTGFIQRSQSGYCSKWDYSLSTSRVSDMKRRISSEDRIQMPLCKSNTPLTRPSIW